MYIAYTYYPAILWCIKERLDFMLAHHCKVLFVRFDVRFPLGTGHVGRNTEMSQFMKTLKAHYKAQGIALHYVWAREQDSSDAPHYHVVVLLNGSKVQHPMGVWDKAAEVWSDITNGPRALVQQCRPTGGGNSGNWGIMIRRVSGTATGADLIAQQQAFQQDYTAAWGWASYLAKEDSKDRAPYRVREFSASRLPVGMIAPPNHCVLPALTGMDDNRLSW